MGLCEAHLTTPPMQVVAAIREEVAGDCQQNGG